MKFTKATFEKFLDLLDIKEIELDDYDYDENGKRFDFYKSDNHELYTKDDLGGLTLDIQINRDEDTEVNTVDINDITSVYFEEVLMELNGEFYSKLEKYIKQFLY